MSRATVITIHGVNPDRQWQAMARSVLEPHFSCKDIVYHDYDSAIGPIKAIISIPLFVIGALSLIISFVSITYFSISLFIKLLAFGILSISVSAYFAWKKRVQCAERIKVKISELCPFERPHIIAHSLGTYIIGNIIKKFPDTNLGRVILVSSVLPCSFPWKRLILDRPMCLISLRNEYGAEDYVTKLVDRVKFIARDMGASGVRGFTPDEPYIVNVSTPTDHVGKTRNAAPVIYNVSITEFMHSDQFLSGGHAKNLWLPILWDISPNEFSNYVSSFCETCDLYDLGMNFEYYNRVEEIGSKEFLFLNRMNFFQYICKIIEHDLAIREIKFTEQQVNSLAQEALLWMPRLVSRACKCINESIADDNSVGALHPHIAAKDAMVLVLNEHKATLQ